MKKIFLRRKIAMVKLFDSGVFYVNGEIIKDDAEGLRKLGSMGVSADKAEASKKTIAYSVMQAHNTSGNTEQLKIKFDAMASHDITYVGIIQTARASGLEKFPIPYVLTNCHNSLCAVGGTINEDDHMFGLSAAKKYGGIYVPAHLAVIHQYMREMMAGCGKMILGSDSHTRYGALGTMAIGEGGGELAKQLLCRTYDVNRPEVIGIYLTGKPDPAVGPQDIALAIIGAVFKNGYVKNKVMEFIGDGIKNLSAEYRNGIDVMTTETTCLSSIWVTDGKIKEWYDIHNRPEDFKVLAPEDGAYYDGLVYVDMSKVKPMIAMPFHPSNVYTIEELNENLLDILDIVEKNGAKQIDNPGISFKLKDKVKNGRLTVEQGVIAGCAGGTYDNIVDAADILSGKTIGDQDFTLSVYPSSQPVFMSLVENGSIFKLMEAGATVRSAFCGPCFGAGDVPPNKGLSIRHSTRNFPNREGSKPGNGQIASVALMDARSIAATAVNHGVLTAATDLDLNFSKPKYFFNRSVYDNRVYKGFGKADPSVELKFGPNITDWPKMSALPDNLLLKVVSYITDPVTTTDELIPSGETSSYRSNPLGLAEFTLSRKDPAYVGRTKEVQKAEIARNTEGQCPREALPEISEIFDTIKKDDKFKDIHFREDLGIGTTIYAVKPGDGSAREQAASCQKVIGGWANIAKEYATKRYRSNLINWGMLPFLFEGEPPFENSDYIFVPNVREAISQNKKDIAAYVVKKGEMKPFILNMAELTEDERKIILAGCLINYYKEN